MSLIVHTGAGLILSRCREKDVMARGFQRIVEGTNVELCPPIVVGLDDPHALDGESLCKQHKCGVSAHGDVKWAHGVARGPCPGVRGRCGAGGRANSLRRDA